MGNTQHTQSGLAFNNLQLLFRHSVKRIVITSTLLTIGRHRETISEDDWNDTAVEIVGRDGARADPWMVYQASRVHAERATWNFLEENRNSIQFDIVAILPVWVWGVSIANSSPPRAAFTNAEAA